MKLFQILSFLWPEQQPKITHQNIILTTNPPSVKTLLTYWRNEGSIWTITDSWFYKYFLIPPHLFTFQFEVEQIARMKPKAKNEHETGLLEYLEEIIGTNQYVEPIEKSFKDLEALNEERLSKQQRLKNVQKEKDSLEEAKQEAESYLTKEQAILDK